MEQCSHKLNKFLVPEQVTAGGLPVLRSVASDLISAQGTGAGTSQRHDEDVTGGGGELEKTPSHSHSQRVEGDRWEGVDMQRAGL